MADPPPVTLFYSYAHKDEAYRQELEKQLKIFQRNGLLSDWHDRKIIGGEEWDKTIHSELEKADIILFLVSPDFIASDYIWDKEVKRGMERHEAGTARVIPVILRPVIWGAAPFAKLQGLPKDGKPVSEWPTRDKGLHNVAEGLEKVLKEVNRLKQAGGANPTLLRRP